MMCTSVHVLRSLKTSLFFVGVVVCAILTSCMRSEPLPQNTTIFYNEPDGVNTLDPAQLSYRASIWVGAQLFDGLVEVDSSMNIVPCLARSWDIDASAKTWTFHLRTDVIFHPDLCFGSASATRHMTAHDVRYSFERLCDARTKSNGLWVFRDKIEGTLAFHEATKKALVGDTSLHIRGIRVVNDSTIQFKLTSPFAPFLALLTMPYCYIVPHEAVTHYREDFFKHPVGTGAFRFVQWNADVELLLSRNEQYFQRDAKGNTLPYMERVSISFIRDTKAEFLQFRKKKLDFLSFTEPSFKAALLTPSGKLRPEYKDVYTLLEAPGFSTDYYGILLDTTKNAARKTPLAQFRTLRQALNYAIDREKIVRYVMYNSGVPANFGFVPPGMPGFDSTLRGYKYNQVKAGKLLEEAGFPQGKGLPTLTLQIGQNQRSAAIAEAVQEQWRSIGVNAVIKQVDFPQHLSMVRNGELSLWRTSWIGDYPDAENFFSLFYTNNIAPKGPNTTRYSNPRADSLYRMALSPLLTEKERFTLYHQLEQMIVNDAPWVFIFHSLNQRLAHSYLHGLTVDGLDTKLVLKTVRKDYSLDR